MILSELLQVPSILGTILYSDQILFIFSVIGENVGIVF